MRMIAVALMALLTTGCGNLNLFGSPNRDAPKAKVVAMVSQCGLRAPGVYSSHMGGETFSFALRAALEEVSLPADRLALVVSLGNKPTPGYGLSVSGARWYGHATLNLNMMVKEPPEDAFTAQVITTPCAVIDVPAEGWDQIRVVANLPGFPVGWVRADDKSS